MNQKVSIIVPIYNVARYVEKCIVSIQTQTYKNIEIILVDDGSQDESGAIADAYAAKDNRIKVIHKTNCGVSAARNSGIDAATGDYICFSDGDDYVLPNYVDYLLNICLANDAEIAYTVDTFTTFQKEQVNQPKLAVISAEEATENILCYKVPIGVYSKMFKRSFLNEHKLRFIDNVYIGEGFNFNITCFQRASKVVMSTERVYYYRRDNDDSAMTKFKLSKCEMALKAIDIIKTNLIIKTPRILRAWKFAYWHTHFDMYCWIVNSEAQNVNVTLYKKCLKIARCEAFIAFKVPTKYSERVRGFLGIVHPRLVAILMKKRNERYAIKSKK